MMERFVDRLDGLRRSPGREPEDRQRFIASTREVHLPLAQCHFPVLARQFSDVLADLTDGGPGAISPDGVVTRL